MYTVIFISLSHLKRQKAEIPRHVLRSRRNRVSSIKKSRAESERSNFVIVNTPIHDVCSFGHVTNYRELVIGCLICHIISWVGLIFLKFVLLSSSSLHLFIFICFFRLLYTIQFQCVVDYYYLDSIQELHVMYTLGYIVFSVYTLFIVLPVQFSVLLIANMTNITLIRSYVAV